MLVKVEDVMRSKDLQKLRQLEEAINYFGQQLGGNSDKLRTLVGAWRIVGLWASAKVRENKDNVAMDGLWYDRYDGYALDFEVNVTFDPKHWDGAMWELKAILDYIKSGQIVEAYGLFVEKDNKRVGGRE